MENNKMKVGFIGGKFLPLHLGHVYAIVKASTYVDLLYVILMSSKNRDAELCTRDNVKYMPAEVRLTWLGETFHDIENIKIIHIEDDYYNDNYNWEEGANMIKKAIPENIDYIFSSEEAYTEHFNKYYPNAKHIVIDAERKNVNISATEIRRNIYKNWDMLPRTVRKYFVKKIALVGTESCGKSTLAKKLAKMYNTEYVHEVGREYCIEFANLLTPEMFHLIAMEHFILQNNKAKNANKMLFIDSEAIVTQFYLDMYFEGKKSKIVEEIAKIQNYDLVLYLEPDVKWVADGFRKDSAEEIRNKNNDKLKKMYNEFNVPLVTITGDYLTRFNKAREAIDALFKNQRVGELIC